VRHSLVLALLSTIALAEVPSLRAFVKDPDAKALEAALKKTAASLHRKLQKVDACEAAAVTSRLEELVAENLTQKKAQGFTLDATRIRRQVIEAEAFKLETFIATGVFPKRYFGYLDEQQDTAAYETRLKTAARKATKACNRWLENAHAPFRVTEQEIIVTFLAEGGAILLRERQDQLESIHPIQGIGLDDIATGFADLEPLVKLLDAEVGTKLLDIVQFREDRTPYLSRNFHFEEAIAGTAAMWVWEKQIAERKLVETGRASLGKRSLDEQFVIASLVYNSGILFDESTIIKVRTLDSGPYVYELSEATKAKRWPLPVFPAKDSLKSFLGGGDYPAQATSWSAVYHVLQRYGAYVGLSRFTDAFDSKGALLKQ
jgi:Tfp pilus assembly protein PilE